MNLSNIHKYDFLRLLGTLTKLLFCIWNALVSRFDFISYLSLFWLKHRFLLQTVQIRWQILSTSAEMSSMFILVSGNKFILFTKFELMKSVILDIFVFLSVLLIYKVFLSASCTFSMCLFNSWTFRRFFLSRMCFTVIFLYMQRQCFNVWKYIHFSNRFEASPTVCGAESFWQFPVDTWRSYRFICTNISGQFGHLYLFATRSTRAPLSKPFGWSFIRWSLSSGLSLLRLRQMWHR